MRRFRVTGPEVLVGGRNFSTFSNTILVTADKIAVLTDDDPRADDLARSPYFEEVDANGAPLTAEKTAETPAETTAETPDEGAGQESTKTRRAKPAADSGGV